MTILQSELISQLQNAHNASCFAQSFPEKEKNGSEIEPPKSHMISMCTVNLDSAQIQKLKDLWEALFYIFHDLELSLQRKSSDKDPKAQHHISSRFLSFGRNSRFKKSGSFSSEDHEETESSNDADYSPLTPKLTGADTGDSITSAENEAVKYLISSSEFRETFKSEENLKDIRKQFWSLIWNDDPDMLLLRFLRARKWNVNEALSMLVHSIHWRTQTIDVPKILFEGEQGAIGRDEEFLDQIRLGKSFFYGVDKQGRPVCYVRARLHRSKDQTENTIEKFTVWVMETGRLMLQPPVETACVVFDLTDFSISNMDYTPVKFIVKCFQAHYPESLGLLIVHKAPFLFQGVWTIIKSWLDPVVVSKVRFTKNVDDLAQYIDPQYIIQELGGPNKWKYTYKEPTKDENEHMDNCETREMIFERRFDLFEQYESLTLKWIECKDTDKELQIRKQRTELANAIIKCYWDLDKHVRARSFYDRSGMLLPDGSVDPYLEKKEKS